MSEPWLLAQVRDAEADRDRYREALERIVRDAEDHFDHRSREGAAIKLERCEAIAREALGPAFSRTEKT
jgi:hypothetical protein